MFLGAKVPGLLWEGEVGEVTWRLGALSFEMKDKVGFGLKFCVRICVVFDKMA